MQRAYKAPNERNECRLGIHSYRDKQTAHGVCLLLLSNLQTYRAARIVSDRLRSPVYSARPIMAP